jgi:uncharacterized membrane protein YvbJ
MKWICKDCGNENTDTKLCSKCDSKKHDTNYIYDNKTNTWKFKKSNLNFWMD